MKIKFMALCEHCIPKIHENGDWFDLSVMEDVKLSGPKLAVKKKKTGEEYTSTKVDVSSSLISLGIAMQLPKGYEAHILPRSSTYSKWHLLLSNSMGIIDNSYCGNSDIWKFGAVALKDVTIPAGTRIAQFKIVLSQKATIWQKIKHLFDRKIEFVRVETLGNKSRGGFGSTGN